MAEPVNLFYSYAHEDEPLRKELEKHLKMLERKGMIRPWHDRRIVPGQPWAAAIDDQLERADLVLLLVSADFVASDYIFGVELKRALERHEAQSCVAVPIIVRDVVLDDLPFMHLQGLPTDLKPVASWDNQDEAWTNVAKGLRAIVAMLHARRPRVAAAVAPKRRQGRPVAAAARPDALMDEVVAGVLRQVDTAEQARGGQAMSDGQRRPLARQAQALIDVPDIRRVLWVDDRPANNRAETAMLAKLQIEVVAVTSTDEARARVAQDAEGFDLVLSDWSRPGDGEAALTLLAALRTQGERMPLVVYHGRSDPQGRAEVAARCRAAGALGEAVLPTELMQLVHQALVTASPAA